MAHAYTTKRGKNKISKLGVRKDHQQNSERQLKSNVPLANLQYNGPKESVFSIGHLANSRIEDRRATATAAAKAAKAIADKCSNPSCTSASDNSELLECSSCHTVRYCGKLCQTTHWEEHKPVCKEVRRAMKARESGQDSSNANISTATTSSVAEIDSTSKDDAVAISSTNNNEDSESLDSKCQEVIEELSAVNIQEQPEATRSDRIDDIN
eukprot:gene30408-39650_t